MCTYFGNRYKVPFNRVTKTDHLSGKPGNIREFDSCQGNVRDFSKNRECQGKNFVREKLPKAIDCKLHICIRTGI